MKKTDKIAHVGVGDVNLIEETLPQESRVQSVLSAIQALKGFKPKTKQDAIFAIHAVSIMNAADKDIKAASYEYLNTRCADCEEHEVDGLKVKYIQNEMKVYNPSKEVEKAEKALEKAKEDLQAARDRAGFKLKPGASYWKAVR